MPINKQVKQKEKTFKVVTTVDIKEEDVSSLLTSSLEGGSAYWARIAGRVDNKADEKLMYRCDIVLKGHGLIIHDTEENKEHILDLKKVIKGLKILSKVCPYQFNKINEDNADADTGDALVQCALFGKIIYG